MAIYLVRHTDHNQFFPFFYLFRWATELERMAVWVLCTKTKKPKKLWKKVPKQLKPSVRNRSNSSCKITWIKFSRKTSKRSRSNSNSKRCWASHQPVIVPIPPRHLLHHLGSVWGRRQYLSWGDHHLINCSTQLRESVRWISSISNSSNITILHSVGLHPTRWVAWETHLCLTSSIHSMLRNSSNTTPVLTNITRNNSGQPTTLSSRCAHPQSI